MLRVPPPTRSSMQAGCCCHVHHNTLSTPIGICVPMQDGQDVLCPQPNDSLCSCCKAHAAPPSSSVMATTHSLLTPHKQPVSARTGTRWQAFLLNKPLHAASPSVWSGTLQGGGVAGSNTPDNAASAHATWRVLAEPHHSCQGLQGRTC
jgi:hypothetical protein